MLTSRTACTAWPAMSYRTDRFRRSNRVSGAGSDVPLSGWDFILVPISIIFRPDQVESQYSQRDRGARCDTHQRGEREALRPFAHHGPPVRRWRRHTEAKEGQARGAEDSERDRDGELRGDETQDVWQDMPPHDPRARASGRPGCLDGERLRYRERLAASQPGRGWPHHEAEAQRNVDGAGSYDRRNQQREDEGRERDEEVDDLHDQQIDLSPHIACQ